MNESENNTPDHGQVSGSNSTDLLAVDYEILHHTLGLRDPRTKEPYRNHFVAGDGHHDMPKIERLIEAGLMEEVSSPEFCGKGARTYIVTDKGKDVAMDTRPKPPKLTKSQQRYQRFLEWGDCFDDFISFCRWDAEPEREWNC